MKKTALLLLICGSIASISDAALADNSIAVTKVKVADAQCDPADRPLKLTDDQLERMHAIRIKYEDAGAARGLELHKLHRQMFDSMSQTNVDKAAVVAIQSKINALENEQANDHLQVRLEMHDVFTAEQRQAMRHHMLEHDMMSHGPGGPGGPGMHPPGPGGFGGPHEGRPGMPPGMGPH